MFKVAQRYYFGDFPHKNSNIFEKIFYDYFGGKSVFPDFRKNQTQDPKFFQPKTTINKDRAYDKKFIQIGSAVPKL